MVEFKFNDRPNDGRLNQTISEYADVDLDAVKLFLDLQWTYREMQKAYDATLAEYGLTETRFIILMFLLRADDHSLTPAVIADKLGATRATVSKILKRLTANDWVIKTNSVQDKRSVLIQLAPAGEQVLTAFLPHNFSAVKTIMAPLSATEIVTLSNLLHKINLGTKKLNSEKSN